VGPEANTRDTFTAEPQCITAIVVKINYQKLKYIITMTIIRGWALLVSRSAAK